MRAATPKPHGTRLAPPQQFITARQSMGSSRSSRTKVAFFTKYLCRSGTDFLGPIGERYAGLYFTCMEQFRSRYDFYWFTGDDGQSYRYDPESNVLKPLTARSASARLSLIKFIASFCLKDFRVRKVCVISYPYFPHSPLLALLMLLLKPLGVRIVVDVQDLHRSNPGTIGYVAWRVIDELYYRCAAFILNADECAKAFRRQARGKTVIIPMAAHDQRITPRTTANRNGKFVVGYIGTIGRVRGFPELIEVVDGLRSEGLDVELVINGNNPDNLPINAQPWIRRYERQPFDGLSALLKTVDVGVIPYVDREYWSLMSITKMATYMAAGLPIVILHLTETSNILTRWHCGISATDWSDFKSAIKRLYADRDLCQILGQNARRAATSEYNWTHQAARLGEFIASLS